MSRIDQYIYVQMLTLFGFFALMLVAIYWINRAVGLLDQLVGDGQSVGVFLQMSMLSIPSVVELTVPMASFAACLFVANKLAQDSELVVMQATGYSSFRLIRPALFFAASVAVMTALVTNLLIPAAAAQTRELRGEIAQNTTAKFLKEGQFLSPAEGVMLFTRKISIDGEMLDIFISDRRAPDAAMLFTADRAFVINDQGEPKLLMLSGTVQRYAPKNGVLTVSYFADLTYALGDVLNTQNTSTRVLQEWSTLQLIAPSAESLAQSGAQKSRAQYMGHGRISWPISAGIVATVAFSMLLLGAYSRFGLLWQIMSAIGALIVLYSIHIVCLTNGPKIEGGWVLAYVTPIVGAAMTVLILWISQRPRRLTSSRAGKA
jgi:lipopolysaccharide export system permease protein